MTLAAVDRLVHHATIIEMNVDRYRSKTAVPRRTGLGRPPTRAEPNENDTLLAEFWVGSHFGAGSQSG